jgi:hypothetical protein
MARSLQELMSDPEEGPLLQACLRDRDGPSRERYVAWLDGRGDPRGELLRLSAILGAPPEAAGATIGAAGSELRDSARALRGRHRELRASVEPLWWALVGPGHSAPTGTVHNCGLAAAERPRVRFRFVCPNEWTELAPTTDPDVRACAECHRLVHRCTTRDRAEALARRGECIAVDPALAGDVRRDVTRHIVGQPDDVDLWGARIFAEQ